MKNINYRFLLIIALKVILITIGVPLLVIGIVSNYKSASNIYEPYYTGTILINLLSMLGILLTATGIVIPSAKTNTKLEYSSVPKQNKNMSKVIRYPNLECPTSSVINESFSIHVQLLIKSPAPEIKAMEIEDTGIPEKLPEVEIVLRARGFDIEGTNTKVISIKRDDDTEERFVLIPRQLGEQQIRVDFYQNGKRIGTARRNIIIYAEEDSGTIEISQSQEQIPLEFKNQLVVPPPDLELCVELDRHNQPNALLYSDTQLNQK